MNILFFHRWTGVRGGGTESHIKGLIENFPSSHKLFLLTRNGSQIPYLSKKFKNLTIFTVSKNFSENDHSYESLLLYLHTSLFMIKSFFKIVWLVKVKKLQIDVISVHFATEAVVARVIRKLFKIPYIFILEGYTDWEAKEAKIANSCVSISHYESKLCEERFGFYPKVIYIGEGKFPLLKKGELSKKVKENNKRVLTVCRLEPRKNLETLLKAISYIYNNKKRSDINFTIGGTGILENTLKSISKELGILKVAKFIGFVPENKVVDLYKKSDLYVLPTFEEGFGIVFVEAMKSGCAIVSTNVSAVPEIVGDAGLLIKDPLDYEVLGEYILKLIDNSSYRLEIASNGLERSQSFIWSVLIKMYEKEYIKAAKKV